MDPLPVYEREHGVDDGRGSHLSLSPSDVQMGDPFPRGAEHHLELVLLPLGHVAVEVGLQLLRQLKQLVRRVDHEGDSFRQQLVVRLEGLGRQLARAKDQRGEHGA